MPEYGLNSLLNDSAEARKYFSNLPGYIRDMIHQRGQSVDSIHELMRYAENLMQGDK